MEDFFNAIRMEASRHPSSIAIASQTGHLHYSTFLGNIASAASAARKKGIGQEQLVVLAAANPNVKLILALALLSLGCRVGYVTDLSLYEASGAHVDAVLSDSKSATAISRAVIPITEDWFRGAAFDSDQLEPGVDVGSIIFSSSGSTGRPKLLEYRFGAIWDRISARLINVFKVDRPRVIAAFAENSGGHFFEACATFFCGGAFLRPLTLHAPNIIDAIQLLKPDYISTSPFILRSIVLTLEAHPTTFRKALTLRTTGSYCAPELQDRALKKLCQQFVSSYGATEAGWIALGTAEQLQKTKNSAGRVLQNVEVRAFRDTGASLPPGTTGRIKVRMPRAALADYLDTEHSRNGAIKDGWFDTGDVGFVDQDSNLIILGRSNNIINTGGDKVLAEVLEETIRTLKEVSDVGVTGMTVQEGFQQICAAIVSSTPLTVQQINNHLIRQGQSSPVSVVRNVSQVPRTENGKIDRLALKELCMQ